MKSIVFFNGELIGNSVTGNCDLTENKCIQARIPHLSLNLGLYLRDKIKIISFGPCKQLVDSHPKLEWTFFCFIILLLNNISIFCL